MCLVVCVNLLQLSLLWLCEQEVKTGETQGNVEGHWNFLYPNFHGSSSTREKSAPLPFLPMVTCKQLSRRTNYWGQGTIIYILSVVGSREAITSLHSGHWPWGFNSIYESQVSKRKPTNVWFLLWVESCIDSVHIPLCYMRTLMLFGFSELAMYFMDSLPNQITIVIIIHAVNKYQHNCLAQDLNFIQKRLWDWHCLIVGLTEDILYWKSSLYVKPGLKKLFW